MHRASFGHLFKMERIQISFNLFIRQEKCCLKSLKILFTLQVYNMSTTPPHKEVSSIY